MATERKVDESQALVKILNEALPDLKRLAPKYVNLNRLMALALEARLRNPLLAKANVESVIAFCKRCAEWGTDRVGAGGVWPVPFWNNKTGSYDMQAIPDWRLLVEKAKKAKAIKHAMADVVRDGDGFSYARGTNPDLTHLPAIEGHGPVIAAYCIYILPDGMKDFVVMSRAELDAIRNRSKAWQTYLKDKNKLCPWNTDPEEMDKKTVIKRAMKLFEGASIELSQLLEADHVAMGFDRFGEQPEPIAMPKVLTANAGASESEQQATTEQAAQSPATPEDAIPVEDNPALVTIENVTMKSGKTGEKPWTRYSIIAATGEIYSTFDLAVADAAKALKGQQAALAWKRDGKYLTCIGIEPIARTEREPGEDDQ